MAQFIDYHNFTINSDYLTVILFLLMAFVNNAATLAVVIRQCAPFCDDVVSISSAAVYLVLGIIILFIDVVINTAASCKLARCRCRLTNLIGHTFIVLGGTAYVYGDNRIGSESSITTLFSFVLLVAGLLSQQVRLGNVLRCCSCGINCCSLVCSRGSLQTYHRRHPLQKIQALPEWVVLSAFVVLAVFLDQIFGFVYPEIGSSDCSQIFASAHSFSSLLRISLPQWIASLVLHVMVILLWIIALIIAWLSQVGKYHCTRMKHAKGRLCTVILTTLLVALPLLLYFPLFITSDNNNLLLCVTGSSVYYEYYYRLVASVLCMIIVLVLLIYPLIGIILRKFCDCQKLDALPEMVITLRNCNVQTFRKLSIQNDYASFDDKGLKYSYDLNLNFNDPRYTVKELQVGLVLTEENVEGWEMVFTLQFNMEGQWQYSTTETQIDARTLVEVDIVRSCGDLQIILTPSIRQGDRDTFVYTDLNYSGPGLLDTSTTYF